MNDSSTARDKSKMQLLLETAQKRLIELQAQGRHQEALDICLQIAHAHPAIAEAWANAAFICAKLGRWQDAIDYGQTALARGSDVLMLYDTLASAYGWLGQWDEARRYGLQALNMRDRLFGCQPVIPLPKPRPLPPSPSAQTREHNIIAFSLFGDNSRYCEPAVLNVQEQPNVYPCWVCRFYVDRSVPENVLSRLRAGGAQIVSVGGSALQWPGPMWRLLALDDRQAHRILFRDADSVISQREAHAVEQWVASGKRFHMIRDWGAYTALMMAGLWGVVAGSLPPLEQLMLRFMNAPFPSRYFADQDFLQRYVWPYARTSLMQHDSVFGFMDAVPFPDGERPEDFHVGYGEGSGFFTAKADRPDGSQVTWRLFRIENGTGGQNQKVLLCSYSGTIKDGTLKAYVPTRYLRWIGEGTACVHIIGSTAG
jgi:hypothetical protein